MPRPPKKFKSLDDDEDVTNILEVTVDQKDDDLENDNVPTEELEISEKDDVQVTTTGEDTVSVSVTSYRSNPPPMKIWSDDPEVKLKFYVGELVTIKGYPDQIYKVMGPCVKSYTYSLKPSGSDKERLNIPEDIIKKAKPDAKWISYWDTINDPYRAWKKKKEEEEKLKVNKKVDKKVDTKQVATKTIKKKPKK